MNGNDSKKAFRREMLRIWEGFSPEERRIRDELLCERLWSCLAEQGNIRSVFAYVGSGWEIDTRPFLNRCLEAGFALGVPLCGKNGQMTVRRIFSLADLAPGHYGLPEPSANAPILSDCDFALIPGLAFSENGERLGRGGGFYDRWLAEHPDCLTVALCPDEVLRAVPTEAHDLPVCRVLTPTRTVFRHPSASSPRPGAFCDFSKKGDSL